MSSVFTLSVEVLGHPAFIATEHLGTDPVLACKFAEEYFAGRLYHGPNNPRGRVYTLALMRDGRIWDVFDGEWNSSRELDDSERQCDNELYRAYH